MKLTMRLKQIFGFEDLKKEEKKSNLYKVSMKTRLRTWGMSGIYCLMKQI